MRSDSFWKEVLEKLFKEFMQFFFPKIYRDIDFSKGYQFLDKEFQQISRKSKTGKRIVDKLVKVYLQDGQEKWLLIHIEIQGQKDARFAQRMFEYYYRIFDKYQRDVLSLALLTDGDRQYRPGAYLKEFRDWDFSLSFKFPLVKIIDYINYEFEKAYTTNVFSIIAHAYLKTLETEGDNQRRFDFKRQFILQLYHLGLNRETILAVYRFIEWLMKLPESLDNKLYQELKQIEEQKKMTYISYAERKGLKKGRKEGKIEGLRQAIESVLEVKFGAVDYEIPEALKKIKSLEKLEALLHQAKLAKSIDEFKGLVSR